MGVPRGIIRFVSQFADFTIDVILTALVPFAGPGIRTSFHRGYLHLETSGIIFVFQLAFQIDLLDLNGQRAQWLSIWVLD